MNESLELIVLVSLLTPTDFLLLARLGEENIVKYLTFLAASLHCCSLFAPVQTIFPEADINVVVFGSLIRMITVGYGANGGRVRPRPSNAETAPPPASKLSSLSASSSSKSLHGAGPRPPLHQATGNRSQQDLAPLSHEMSPSCGLAPPSSRESQATSPEMSTATDPARTGPN